MSDFYYEESGCVEDSVFKKIFLAKPLDNDIHTILHDNLWDLYVEDKDKLLKDKLVEYVDGIING